MSDKIILKKLNEVYYFVYADKSIKMELYNYFSFYAKDYKFTPAYRNKIWDGKERLYNIKEEKIYIGLIPYIKKFCKERSYQLVFEEKKSKVNPHEIHKFVQTLNLPYEPYDYQYYSLFLAAFKKRCFFLSATNSGKSLITYLITRYFNKKTMIIVPNIQLVEQLYKDFKSYGFDVETHVQRVYAAYTKDISKSIVISTWQSAVTFPDDYLKSIDVVIGDEGHLFSAKSLKGLMDRIENAKVRIGMSGSLDGSLVNKLTLEGMFGSVVKIVKAKELIDRGISSKLNINAIALKYSTITKKLMSGTTYDKEIDFLIGNEKRNSFIKNLAKSLNGNVLILFDYVDKHGTILYNDLVSECKSLGRPVYFIYGDVKVGVREEIRSIVEMQSNAIIVASYKTFSTGINIKKLNYLIFASPSKSVVRILQSIGRMLRKGNGKDKAVLYDLVDDLEYEGKSNYAVKHFLERIEMYISEEHKYKIYEVEIE